MSVYSIMLLVKIYVSLLVCIIIYLIHGCICMCTWLDNLILIYYELYLCYLFKTFKSIVFWLVTGPLVSVFLPASSRMRQAYTPGSQCSYFNKFNMFIAFCIHYNISLHNHNLNNVISFGEFLASSGLSTHNYHLNISH